MRHSDTSTSLRDDLVLAGGISGTLFLFGFWVRGGPLYWDDLAYLNLALNPSAAGQALNRYAHIYLLKPFAELAPSPLDGAAAFWWFLIAITAGSIVLAVRRSGPQGLLAPLAALIFFLAQPVIFESSGAPLADFTVMALGAVAAVTFLESRHGTHRRRFILLLTLGFLLFLAMKSKETAIPIAAVFIIGVAARTDGTVRDRIRRLALVLGGMGFGQILLFFADALFLGDPFFSVRPESVRELLQFNLREEWPRAERSWFDLATSGPLLLPFMLSVIALPRRHDRATTEEKLIWIIPFAIMLFLTASMIKGAWGIIPRYFIPAIPFFCISAAHAFDAELRRRSALAVVAAAAVVLGAAALWWPSLQEEVNQLGWDGESFFAVAIIPSALVIAIAVLAYRGKPFLRMILLSSAALLATAPALLFFISLPIERASYHQSRARFEAIVSSAPELSISEETRFFVSEQIQRRQGTLCRNAESCSWMFSIALGIDLQPEQFTVSRTPSDVLKEPYDYAFLTAPEWRDVASARGHEYFPDVPDSFGEQYPLFASISSYHDPDPAQLRRKQRDATVPLLIDEDQAQDDERQHGYETLAFLAFDQSGMIQMRKSERIIGEIQPVEALLRNPRRIDFAGRYEHPVVFFSPFWYSDDDPSAVRIRRVSSDHVVAHVQEAPSRLKPFARGWGWMLVVEKGSWPLDGGGWLEARDVEVRGGQSGTGLAWEPISLSGRFQQMPAVVTQIQTFNDETWLKTRQKPMNGISLALALESEDGASHNSMERVGVLAATPGEGWIGTLAYRAAETPDLGSRLSRYRTLSRGRITLIGGAVRWMSQ